jgi:hypothetical protein
MMPWVRRRRGASKLDSQFHRKNKVRPALEQLEDRCVPATFTVSTVAQLYAAVAAADAAGGSSTINIKPGHYLLNAGQLTLTANITFNGLGTGPGQTIIDAQGASRVFEVPGDDRTESWNNLTITGGNSTSHGGGVDGAGDTQVLSFNKVVVTNNNASAAGAGIYEASGSVTLVNSFVTNNTAGTRGGGIDLEFSGAINLTNTHVDHNDATGSGGGIFEGPYKPTTALSMSSSTVDFNTAGASGGGIWGGPTINMLNSHVDGNVATGNGGGIFLAAQEAASTIHSGVHLTMTSSTMGQTAATLGNIAGGSGGGLFLGATTAGAAYASSISLNSSHIDGNTATGGGGGINAWSAFPNTLSISLSNNSSMNGNHSADGGAAIIGANGNANAQITVNIDLSSVNNNTSTSNAGGILFDANGGAGSSMEVSVTRSTIAGNHATGGSCGGLYLFSLAGGTFVGDVHQDNISGNVASGSGGGLAIFQGSLVGNIVVVNDTLNNNTAGAGGGGIVILNGGATATTNQTFLVNLTVASNHSNTTGDGGGIDLAGGVASLGNSIIVYNTSGATADDLKGAVAFDYFFGGVTPLGAPNIASSIASVTGSNFFSDPFNFTGNPLLGFLQVNPPSTYSPPTATRAITASSVAAFKGSVLLDNAFANFTALLDQRGLNRQAPHPGKVDLGAYD